MGVTPDTKIHGADSVDSHSEGVVLIGMMQAGSFRRLRDRPSSALKSQD